MMRENARDPLRDHKRVSWINDPWIVPETFEIFDEEALGPKANSNQHYRKEKTR
jgi:hypothetical protein